MTLRRLALVVALAATTAAVSAQRPPAVFRAGVELVYLDVTVTAADGSIVTGLTQDDFEIFDEGVRHDVAVFSAEPEPISLGILIDISRSMAGDRMQAAINAADAMGRALQPKDRWSVFTFNTELNPVFGWRPYEPSAVRALNGIKLGGGTELFKSVAAMVPKFRDASLRKRAMLVITDGSDNAVQLSRPNHSIGPSRIGAEHKMPDETMVDHADKAVTALRTGEVMVYGLGIGWGDVHVPSLEKLADPTGGGVAVAKTTADLEILAKFLTDELRQQYTLGFSPLKAADGKYRRLKVVAKNPEHTARTRAGYVAKKP
jgi:Ca-activated chloride channel family protein